jgi:hypothetical protein
MLFKLKLANTVDVSLLLTPILFRDIAMYRQVNSKHSTALTVPRQLSSGLLETEAEGVMTFRNVGNNLPFTNLPIRRGPCGNGSQF